MSQTFEGATPQVVRGKQKFKDTQAYDYFGEEEDDEGRQALNIMYDKRVFRGNTHNINLLKQTLTPAQKEEQRIKLEREKKKVEMIKQQLLEFKKQKNKSVYELRPGPPARIEVDLTEFLTEQNKEPAEEANVKVQTDEFLPKPPSPRYVPKKTGIDKFTEIGDYDLFDFDMEVQPILNVLLSKTCEQAILEVEEDTELDEIRKFKDEYQKRQEVAHNDWQQEVQREIRRIKKKNNTLMNARARREQQIKTMGKLQCLNVSKNFLRGCFMGTMKQLAKHSFWRDSFKDQLSVTFRDDLLSKVFTENSKYTQAGSLLDNLAVENMDAIKTQKEQIKNNKILQQKRREKSRLIESTDQRIVHFVFDPQQQVTETPFTRKFVKLLTGELQEFLEKEEAAMVAYAEGIANEAEDLVHPITFGTNPFYELELFNLQRISFAVSDNPFMKTDTSRFYPEIHIVSGKGELLSTIGPEKRQDSRFSASEYCENFRDDKLKINDDRKVKLTLGDFNDKDTMMILTVRSFEGKFDAQAYTNAWFRLQNEDTNQSIDYTYIKKVREAEGIEDDAAGSAPADEEEDGEAKNAGVRSENIFLAGRIYREDVQNKPKGDPATKNRRLGGNGFRWIYERYNKVINSAKFENGIGQAVAELQAAIIKSDKENEERVEEAKLVVMRAQEERRQAQAAAAAKKKGAKKPAKGKKVDSEEEEGKQEKAFVVETKKELDLSDPDQFGQALRERAPRPFTFGPVTFSDLANTDAFDDAEARQRVCDLIDTALGEPMLCIKGYQVQIRKRTFKRRSTMLKHGRFLKNLVVKPIYPEKIEEEPVEEQNEGDNESQE